MIFGLWLRKQKIFSDHNGKSKRVPIAILSSHARCGIPGQVWVETVYLYATLKLNYGRALRAPETTTPTFFLVFFSSDIHTLDGRVCEDTKLHTI